MQSLLLGREKRRGSAVARPPEEELLDDFRKQDVETILAQVSDLVPYHKKGTYVEFLDTR